MLTQNKIWGFKMKVLKKDYLTESKEGKIPENDFIYNIYNFEYPKSFETLITQRGPTTFTHDHIIKSILLAGSLGFNNVTLHFGNFGHIHLEREEFEQFRKGINWIYNKMRKYWNHLDNQDLENIKDE